MQQQPLQLPTTAKDQSHKQQHKQQYLNKDAAIMDIELAPAAVRNKAQPLLSGKQMQQLVDGSVVSLNPAEWLVDVFTQADREGRANGCADAYAASQLKQVGWL